MGGVGAAVRDVPTEQGSRLEVPAAAGFLTDDMAGGDTLTPLEYAVDLRAEELLGADLLRGYSWVTLLQAGELRLLGGVQAGRAGGAFAEVRPLPGGGCLARATQRLFDYDDAA